MTLTISIGAFIVISMISYFIALFYTLLNNIEVRTYSLLTTFQVVFIITKLLYNIIPSESLWIIGTMVLVIFKICLYFFMPIINLLYFLLILFVSHLFYELCDFYST